MNSVSIRKLTASLLLTVGFGFAAWMPSEVAAAGTVEDEQHCLALAIFWEARGEGRRGMTAVGWTILNRVDSTDFPDTPCGVVYQGGETPPCQFSWWCDGKSDRPRNLKSWRTATIVASHLLANPPADPTGGALYFHSVDIPRPWTKTPTATIGRHIFYR